MSHCRGHCIPVWPWRSLSARYDNIRIGPLSIPIAIGFSAASGYESVGCHAIFKDMDEVLLPEPRDRLAKGGASLWATSGRRQRSRRTCCYIICKRRPEARVIMLPMYSDPIHVCRALQAGATGYAAKKAIAKEVVDAIRAVHSGKRYLSRPLVDSVIDHFLSRNDLQDPMERLSSRERQVLQMLAEGRSVYDIACTLSLSPKTVEPIAPACSISSVSGTSRASSILPSSRASPHSSK
jgi:hypothetical protein